MKRAVVVGERQSAVIDEPMLEPFDNWVVVKVHAAPMCTEYKHFLAGGSVSQLGHEAAGEVVAVARPGKVKVGDRVVAMPLYGCGSCSLCNSGDFIHCEDASTLGEQAAQGGSLGTYAQYILKPDWLLPKIPDGVSYEAASLACCGLGASFGAMQRLGVDAFTTILVTGAGPVGLGAVVNARFRGARVIVVESVPYRVEKALDLGAEIVIDPRDPDALAQIKSLTGGRGADCALDCSGTVAAERLCIDATRRMGAVAYVGECMNDLPIRVSPDLIRKGLTVQGSWHYNLNDFDKVMHVIQNSPLVDKLVSHRFPMSAIQTAFEQSVSHQSAKIILQPWQ